MQDMSGLVSTYIHTKPDNLSGSLHPNATRFSPSLLFATTVGDFQLGFLMASKPQIDDDDDFGGDYPENGKRSGDKRAFGDLEEEEEDDDVFGSKKGKKAEESGPGAATGMILSLRESLQNCKDNLAKCQAELEDAQSEIQKWHSAFQNGPAAPSGANPEPALAVTYLQNLKSSEESLNEKLEKAKKREAAFIVTYAKREQEIADLKFAVRDLKKQVRPPSIQTRKLLLDPAIHEEFSRLKNLVEEKEKKVKELQENVAAVNFSANSRMGKMLMAKCRTLQEENEEIGAMASEGKIHELGMKIAVLNSQNAEIRNQFDALYKHMDGLTNDVERSNEMVCILQDKLEAKDCELEKLKDELSRTKEMLTPKEAKEMVNDDKEMLTPKEASPKEEMVNDDKEMLVQKEATPEEEISCHDDNDDKNHEMDPAEVDIET